MGSAAIDVAFMPIDAERREKVDFGPAYFFIESTNLVRQGSDIKSLSDVDRPNVRVVGIANTATIRAAGRALKNTTIGPVNSEDAKASGMVRRAFDDAGLKDLVVAPSAAQ